MDASESNNSNGNDKPSFHPMFSIAPAGNASSASLNDWLDLNDIFYDDFFPPGIDFEAYFEEGQSHIKSFEVEQRNQQQEDNNNQNSMYHLDTAISIKSELKPRTKTILIPPSMPLVGSSITQSNSSSKGKASKLDDNASEDEISDEDDTNKKSKKSQKKSKTSKLSNTSVDNDSTLGNDILDDSQRIERRERNREHAKRSRIRKRVLLETLQDQLSGLREQNIKLRRIVVEKIPKQANKILSECTTTESDLLANLNTDTEGDDENMYADGQQRGRGKVSSSFSVFKPSRLTSNIASEIIQIHQPSSSSSSSTLIPKQGGKILMEPDFRLMQSLVTSQQNFVLSDPSLPDNPIVYASDGFCRLSGYKRQDVLGRNCRFLQGPGTDQAAVDVIRKGVAEGRDISVCLLNYRADGSPFWNQFFLGALKDVDGQVVNYVGVQCAVNTIPISEMKDRVKKLPMPDDI